MGRVEFRHLTALHGTHTSPRSIDAQPVPAGERVQFLDVLRGFALSGVLVANLVWYECDMLLTRAAAAALPTHTLDAYAKAFVVFFVTGKFITIFSVVFAVGFDIQTRRVMEGGASASLVYGRRLVVLFVLGCLHMALLWFGDILLMYSLMGGVLLVLRRWQPGRAMLVVAAVLILFSRSTFELVNHTPPPPPPAAHSARQSDSPRQERVAAAFRRGYSDVVSKNVRLVAGDLVGAGVILFLLPEIFGRFLLGFYAGRRGWFVDITSHAPVLWRALPWLLLVGAIGNGVAVAREWNEPAAGAARPLWLLTTPVIQLGILSMAAFYTACLALLMRGARSGRVLAHLAPVGRMALTNYLTHSVVFLLIMTGVGLGAAGRFGATVCLAISVVVFGAQIALSAWWLRRFRFGPVEWVWRSLTYGRPQTMRVEPAAAQAST